MELGVIFPSYNKLLRIENTRLAQSKISKSKRERETESIKPKSEDTSISSQGKDRVVDVSI